jgi:ligand-binding SRPBCC domain-containing protein
VSIKISEFENEFRLEAILTLPKELDVVFPYFSSAHNLEELTPPFLRFKVLSSPEIGMAAGTVINYGLQLHGIPLRWRSLISCWNPPFRFVDEQLCGPYRYWIHEHIFEKHAEGVLVKDFVRYQVFGGKIVHDLFVKKDLMKIFTFRHEKLLALFS